MCSWLISVKAITKYGKIKYFFWPQDDAQNLVDAKTDVKDEIPEEQEVKTEGDKCSW
jgi:hypothetical protein